MAIDTENLLWRWRTHEEKGRVGDGGKERGGREGKMVGREWALEMDTKKNGRMRGEVKERQGGREGRKVNKAWTSEMGDRPKKVESGRDRE